MKRSEYLLLIFLTLWGIHTVSWAQDDVDSVNHDKKPVRIIELVKFQGKEGRNHFDDYLNKTRPILQKYGAEVEYMGEAQELIIGDKKTHSWDAVLFVHYPHMQGYLNFLKDQDYVDQLTPLKAQSLSDSASIVSHAREIPGEKVYDGRYDQLIEEQNQKGIGQNSNFTGVCSLIGRALLTPQTPVYLLNLINFKDSIMSGGGQVVNDSGEPLKGQELYEYYMAVATPHLQRHGASAEFWSQQDQVKSAKLQYDGILMVRYPNRWKIATAATDKGYKQIVPLRPGALVEPDNSVLLATKKVDSFKSP